MCSDGERGRAGPEVVLDKATADEVDGVFWCDFCCRSRSVRLRDSGGGDSSDLGLSMDPGKMNAELDKFIRDALEGH